MACFKPSDGNTETNLIVEEDDWDDWDKEEELEEEEEVVDVDVDVVKDEGGDSSKCMWGLVKHLITIERQTEIR